MTTLVRSLGLGLLLAGIAMAGWQEIDSITSRDTSDITAQSNARSVACDAAGNIHVVWRGRLGARRQVWYSRYDAPSGHWSQDSALTTSPEGVCDPACVLGSSGDFYVSYEDSASGMLHLLKRSTAGLWTELDSLAGQQGDSVVSLASDESGTVHGVWRRGDDVNPVICYASFASSMWSRADTVNVPGTTGTWPSIACSPDGSVMVVWSGPSPARRILSRRRVAEAWQDEEVVYDQRLSKFPCVTWGGSAFHAAWQATGSPWDFLMVRSRNEIGWGDTARVNQYRVGQVGVSIAADADGALHVAWSGNDSSSPSYYQIQYRTRPAGDTWQAQEHLTEGANNSRERVSVTARDSRVQVAWSDQPAAGQAFAVRMRRYERVHDVGVSRIEQPTLLVDSGALVVPKAWVRNNGRVPKTNVNVAFRIASDSSRRVIASLNPGDSVAVSFDTWPAAELGWHVMSCSTSCDSDEYRPNDVLRDSFFVRLMDVAVDSIVRPVGSNPRDTVEPEAVVSNLGNMEAQFSCFCRIRDSAQVVYCDTAGMTVPPQAARTVRFDSWLGQPGSYTVSCSTALTGDRHPENDADTAAFELYWEDVAVVAVVYPTEYVDSGTVVVPAVRVRNAGSGPSSFRVHFAIGRLYTDSVRVDRLGAGLDTLVSLSSWDTMPRGWWPVCCSVALAGDMDTTNNAERCSTFVRVRDAAPAEILSPAGIISRGEVRPRVKLLNLGNEVVGVPVRFRIFKDSAQVYLESLVVALSPNESRDTSFPTWLAQSGTYTGVCSTALVGDMQPGNDTMRCGFRVAQVDAAVLAIRVPTDTISEGWVEPRILVVNYGVGPATFYAHFTCERLGSVVYRDSVFVGLDSMNPIEVTFREWKAGPGDYSLLATVSLGDDENPHNDSVSAAVYVESLESKRWRERASVPRGPWGRPVRDGGSLVAVADGLFALKGANTREWYRYSAAADSWVALADMPLGVDGHKVKAGASLCWDGNSAVFALKGTGAREFWRYDIPGDSWHQLAGLPEHTRGARYGSGLVFVPVEDTDKVFMVKGSSTRDFLVYWVRQNEWHACRQLPLGLDSTTARHGTCLALLGGRIFCLKGRTTEFYEYFPDGDSWLGRAAPPILGPGRQWKKPSKGAALASDGSRFLYAIKGGRCNEFWRYDSRGDSWSQLDDFAKGTHRRKVGHGGALAWLGGRAYALKGGGSNEFWCFDPLAGFAVASTPQRDAAVEADLVPLPVTRRAPAFLRCGRVAEYPVPQGATGVLIIDAAGRVIARQAAASPVAEVRFSRPGVYFVVMTGDSASLVARTMVVR